MDTVLDRMLLGVVGPTIGFLLGLFADHIRRLIFRPRVRAQYGQGPDYISETIKGEESYTYVRGIIKNTSLTTARECRVYLTRIDKWDSQVNGYKRRDFRDSLRLRWSAVPEGERTAAITLPKGITQAFDIFRASTADSGQLHVQASMVPSRYLPIFAEPGQFRLTIQVVTENYAHQTSTVTIQWGGTWNSLSYISSRT